MDGQKLAEHCRALRPSMPVIYTTGRGTPPTLVSGAVFLPKPYRVAHLIDVIRDLTGFDDRSTI
jgi:FixJ family two-component response regulator